MQTIKTETHRGMSFVLLTHVLVYLNTYVHFGTFFRIRRLFSLSGSSFFGTFFLLLVRLLSFYLKEFKYQDLSFHCRITRAPKNVFECNT